MYTFAINFYCDEKLSKEQTFVNQKKLIWIYYWVQFKFINKRFKYKNEQKYSLSEFIWPYKLSRWNKTVKTEMSQRLNLLILEMLKGGLINDLIKDKILKLYDLLENTQPRSHRRVTNQRVDLWKNLQRILRLLKRRPVIIKVEYRYAKDNK